MSTKLIIGDGSWQELAQLECRAAHDALAAAEGLCPEHRAPMQPVDVGNDEVIAGRCAECGEYWFYDTRTSRLGHSPDHDEKGDWISPYRVLG